MPNSVAAINAMRQSYGCLFEFHNIVITVYATLHLELICLFTCFAIASTVCVDHSDFMVVVELYCSY